jgi:uncharacterized protein YggE
MLATLLALASGSVVIIGNGEAAAPPEVVRMSVSVTSICYDTSRGAKDANAQLANGLLGILQTYSGADDHVTVTGGVNVRQTEYAQVGSATRTLCEMKWRATNSLTIATHDLARLPDLQDQVLGAIDASGPDPEAVAQTYAELRQPSFELTPETMRSLRATAQANAYDDAKAQFDVFAARCQFQDAQLTNISPPTYDSYPRQDGTAAGEGTPVIPDDINVTAQWRFEWTFTPTAGCYLAR